jgi:hypothetical protein
MHIGVAGLALLVVVGVEMAATSCSSAPATVKPAVPATRSASAAAVSGSPDASSAAPRPAGSIPAGYARVGGAAQGISIAVPASWVAVDLTKESPAYFVRRAGLSGAAASTFLGQLQSLQQSHEVFVFDGKSAVDSPEPSAPILTAECDSSGTTDVGAAGVPTLTKNQLSGLGQVQSSHIAVQDLEIGGVPGMDVSYHLKSETGGTLYGSELAVLPKPGRVCYVTVIDGKTESFDSVLSVAAATAQFP